MYYFELFEIPVSFQPDEKEVKRKFYQLSRQYHPDFFTGSSEPEKEKALELSSQVNKAYKTFQNRDEIIKYILQEKGLLQEEEKYELPPSFLMQMLELSEQMADARMKEDSAAIAAAKNEIDNIQTEIYDPVQAILENYKEGITSEKELLQVKDYYYKKKYLTRILAGMH